MTLALILFIALSPFLIMGFSTLQEKLERHEYDKHFED